MKYYRNTYSDNELYHWKYIKKIPVGKGYRYFYTWDEYRAFLKDPTAELQKTKDNIQSNLTSSKKKVQNKINNGKNKANEIINRNNNTKKITIGNVKSKNAKRDPTIKERLKNIAKKASEKWQKGKENLRSAINKGKKWVDDLIETQDEKKERERKEAIKKEKQLKNDYKNLKEKYKYVDKKLINGKMRYFYSKDELNAYNRKQKYISNEPAFMKNVKHSDVPYTSSEDAMLVNPKFENGENEYTYNCAECTAIYELRRRGYDVESNGECGLGSNASKYNTDERFKLFYKDADIHYMPPANSTDENLENMKKEFAKYPNGSRGDISVKWIGTDSAHSMVWEKDSKGKIHIIDAQASGHGNRVEYDLENLNQGIDCFYTERNKVKGHFFKQKTGFTRITRTDNLELRPEIKKICQNSSESKKKPDVSNAYVYRHSFFGTSRSEREMSEKEYATQYPNLMTYNGYKKIRTKKKKDEFGITDEYIR